MHVCCNVPGICCRTVRENATSFMLPLFLGGKLTIPKVVVQGLTAVGCVVGCHVGLVVRSTISTLELVKFRSPTKQKIGLGCMHTLSYW